MKKIIYIAATIIFAAHTTAAAQGVRCNFVLNIQNVQNAGDAALASMKSTISDFIATTNWVEQNMEPFEQIECNIVLTITEQTAEYEYKGKLQVQAQRPIYGSTYNSTLLNVIDNDVEFRYSPNEPMDFSMMSHNVNNLTPMLAFWIYVVIGMDGDSFAPMGGTAALRTAQRIVQNAQSESRGGWTSTTGSKGKNRYSLVEDLLGARYLKLRRTYYNYHRLGMDAMTTNSEEAKTTILSAIKEVEALYKEKPDITMYPIALFFDAKADEIVNIFSTSTTEEKTELYTILAQTNVLNEPKYRRLKE